MTYLSSKTYTLLYHTMPATQKNQCRQNNTCELFKPHQLWLGFQNITKYEIERKMLQLLNSENQTAEIAHDNLSYRDR